MNLCKFLYFLEVYLISPVFFLGFFGLLIASCFKKERVAEIMGTIGVSMLPALVVTMILSVGLHDGKYERYHEECALKENPARYSRDFSNKPLDLPPDFFPYREWERR